MRLDITGRHVEITPPLRQLITRRLAKIERLLNGGTSINQTARKLKVGVATVHRIKTAMASAA